MRTTLKRLSPIWFTLASGSLWAHDGHGAATPVHWHATDAYGFVAGAAVIGALVWLARRK